MSGNIKGITISFRGDTTKLDSALRKINTETRNLDKELRAVDKALKFNPSNVELWRQKQDLLNQKLKETNEKVALIRETLKKVESGEIEMAASDTAKLKRELIETESKAKYVEAELKAIGNVNLKAVGEQFQQVGGKIQGVGQKMRGLSVAGAAATTAIGTLAYKAGKSADDLNTLSKVTGISTGKLQQYKAAADLVDVSVEAMAKSNQKLKKSMYSAENGGKKQAAAFEELGVSVTDANGNFRDSEDVFQDVITALGTVEDETKREALAQTLMGKSASELNPLIEDQGETYKQVSETLKKYNLDFVDQETIDKANEFNDSLDTMKLIGQVALEQVGTNLAGYLAPVLEKIVNWVGKIAEWLGKLDPKVLTVIATIGGLVAVLAPLLITIGKISTGIGAIIKVIGVIGPAITGLAAGPMLGIVAAIAAVVAIGVALYKNWDKIKAAAKSLGEAIKTKWNNIKESVTGAVKGLKEAVAGAWDTIKTKTKNAWEVVKTAITSPFKKAKETLDGIIEKIKNLFPIDLSNFFGKIKLPHISWDWEEVGDFFSIPKISIDWYKKGGIFDSPTIAGIGEAGPEAVVPLDKLWNKLDAIAESGSNAPVINVYAPQGMDVNQLAAKIDAILARREKQRTMAYGGI